MIKLLIFYPKNHTTGKLKINGHNSEIREKYSLSLYVGFSIGSICALADPIELFGGDREYFHVFERRFIVKLFVTQAIRSDFCVFTTDKEFFKLEQS